MNVTEPEVPLAPPGYCWRSAASGDIPTLEELQRCCHGRAVNRHERALFEVLVSPPPDFQSTTLCALHGAGEIGAFAAALVYGTETEDRGELEVLVHPALRSLPIESALLRWAEGQARVGLSQRAGDRPAVLRIPYSDRRDHASILYPWHGFRLTFVSTTMRRDLNDPIPAPRPPGEPTLLPWSDERAALFYEVARAAFHDSPQSHRSSTSSWRQAMTESPAFRPELSLLLLERQQPVGYLICWVDGAEKSGPDRSEGWITQVGIHPSRQGRGLGAYLICHVMLELSRLGIGEALLEVDPANQRAFQLYQGLGFATVAHLHIFTKEVPHPPPTHQLPT